MLDELVGGEVFSAGDALGSSVSVATGASSVGGFEGAKVDDGDCGGVSQKATLFPKSDPKPLHPSVVMSFGHENKKPPVIWGEHPLGVYTQSHSQPFIEADKHS